MRAGGALDIMLFERSMHLHSFGVLEPGTGGSDHAFIWSAALVPKFGPKLEQHRWQFHVDCDCMRSISIIGQI